VAQALLVALLLVLPLVQVVLVLHLLFLVHPLTMLEAAVVAAITQRVRVV
jgi:hypothetical protein